MLAWSISRRRRLTANEVFDCAGAVSSFFAMSQFTAPSSSVMSARRGRSSWTARITSWALPVTLRRTLPRSRATRRCGISASVSFWKRPSPAIVRSSSVRLRSGKLRKNERPACRQPTRAFTLRFTSACTRCAIRSLKKSGRTASSTSTTVTDVAATAAMRLDRFIHHLWGTTVGEARRTGLRGDVVDTLAARWSIDASLHELVSAARDTISAMLADLPQPMDSGMLEGAFTPASPAMTPLHRMLVVAALASASPLAAQPTTRAAQPATLARGATVDRRLAPGARDEYTLPLTGPAFVQGEVDQHSVDVVVTVMDSTGRTLGEFDGPARGPERFTLLLERAGRYRIRVATFRADSGGDYTLHLRRVDRPATDPVGRIDQLMSAYDAAGPGAAIGVLRGGKLVFAKGYGRASLEYPSPIGPRTVFHVASVSKQFTAFAVILLAREGKLSLDDDVRKYISELPDLGKTITLRHLLTHTSGIRDQWDLWGLSGGRMDDVITQDDLFRLVTRQP